MSIQSVDATSRYSIILEPCRKISRCHERISFLQQCSVECKHHDKIHCSGNRSLRKPPCALSRERYVSVPVRAGGATLHEWKTGNGAADKLMATRGMSMLAVYLAAMPGRSAWPKWIRTASYLWCSGTLPPEFAG